MSEERDVFHEGGDTGLHRWPPVPRLSVNVPVAMCLELARAGVSPGLVAEALDRAISTALVALLPSRTDGASLDSPKVRHPIPQAQEQ